MHGIVRAHHGSIVVHSSPGVGTSFELYLPLCADLPPPADALADAADRSVHLPAGRGEYIRYLDDDAVMGVMVERLLLLDKGSRTLALRVSVTG